MSFRLLLVDANGVATAPALAIRQLREFPGNSGVSVHFRPVRNDRLFESAKEAGELAYRVLAGEGVVRSQLWVEYEVAGNHANVTGRSSDLLFALALITAKWASPTGDYPAIAATGCLDFEGVAAVQSVQHAVTKVAAAVLALAAERAALVFYPAENDPQISAWRATAEIPAHVQLCAVKRLEDALNFIGITLQKVYLGNPFRGLQHFDYEHRAIFFGRDREVREILGQLLRREAAGVPGVLVEGASGSGKSSFLRAGVLPALVRPSSYSESVAGELQTRPVSSKVARAIWRPGLISPPVNEQKLAVSVRDCWMALSELELDNLHEPLMTLESLARICHDRWPKHRRFVWLIDQFEEVFSWDQKAPLIDSIGRFLQQLQEGGVWTLATIRADSVPLLKSYEPLRRVFGSNEGQYYLARMRGTALDEVITLPARAADLTFGRGTDGKPLDQTLREEAYQETDSLPLLQYTLNELYLRRTGRQLTYHVYQQLGGMAGSIATSAGAILAPHGAQASQAVHRLFRSLVSVDDHGRATRRYAPLSEIAADAAQNALIKRLADARLCVTDQRDGQAVVAFTHDTLLQTLPALTDWLTQEAGLLQTRELALRDTRLWQQNGESEAWLAAEDKLMAFATLERSEIYLSAPIREFIVRSRRRARRTTRIKRAAVGAIATLAVIASAAGWMASKKQREAELQTANARDAQSRLLTETAADRLKDGDLAYGRGIIMEVLGRHRLSDFATKAAMNVFQEIRALDPQLVVLSGHTGAVRRGAFSPDGTRVVTASQDGTARIWDAATGTQLTVLQAGKKHWVMSAEFSPDGHLLATAADTVKIWDAHSGKLLRSIQDEEERFGSAYFSPDGKQLVTGLRDLRIWDVATGKRLLKLEQNGVNLRLGRFSPDGRQLVSVASDHSGRIWDLKSGKVIAVLRGHLEDLLAIAYSPDGTRIVTASEDASTRIWDARSGALLIALPEHRGQIWDAEFSPDSRKVVTVGTDKTARIWDARTGALIKILSGHTAILSSGTYSKDGSRILTTAYDGTARVWDPDAANKAIVLTAGGARMTGVEFSPDGETVMTTAEDNAVRLWDAHSGAPVGQIPNTSEINVATFSPDGHRILLATQTAVTEMDARTGSHVRELSIDPNDMQGAEYSRDGLHIVAWDENFVVRVWDVKTGQRQLQLAGHKDFIQNAEFSPDDNQVLTASVDKTARIWDAHSGRQMIVFPHTDHVNSGYFSRDGARVVTSSNDGLVRIWDAHRGELLGMLGGNRSVVYSAVFSHDGKHVASGSRDNLVRLWATDTGMPLQVFAGHTERIYHVAYSPDGRQIASVSSDGTARIWDATLPADPATQTIWARAALSDPLSVAQRAQLGLEPEVTGNGRFGDSTECDRAAGAYYDPDRHAPGVVQTQINGDIALSACQRAGLIANEARRIYQQGRSLRATNDIAGATQAFDHAISLGYHAASVDLAELWLSSAFENVDPTTIVALYKQAWQAGVRFAGFELAKMEEDRSIAGQLHEDAWTWYQRAANVGQPNAIARFARRSEERAIAETDSKRRLADLLEAFSLYSKASAIAEADAWPDDSWKHWRYRRSSLARYLARQGMMKQVADAFREAPK